MATAERLETKIDEKVVNPHYYSKLDEKELHRAAQSWYNRKVVNNVLAIKGEFDGTALAPKGFETAHQILEAAQFKIQNISGAMTNPPLPENEDYRRLAFSRAIHEYNGGGTHRGIFGF